MATDKALTANQKRFIEEYAADRNATQAYFRAYGRTTSKGKRRTYRTAQVQSSKLLSNPIIAAEVGAAQEAYASKVRVSRLRVLQEVAALAFADAGDVYEADAENGGLPRPRPWSDVSPAARRAIQSVKLKRKRLKAGNDGTEWELEELEYKFHPKADALDKLCKRLGFYESEGDKTGGQSGTTVELAARLAALLAAGGDDPKPEGIPGGASPSVPAVGTEPGTTGASLPESGR